MASLARIRYLDEVESSDERATAQLIAERTLALSGVDLSAQPPRQRRLVLLVSASLCLLVVLGVVLWGVYGRDAAARPDRREAVAATPGQKDAEEGYGYLNCNSWPSAAVLVDGRRLPGTTPLRSVRLPAGAHTLTLLSSDGSLRKEVPVNILPAQTRTVAVALER